MAVSKNDYKEIINVTVKWKKADIDKTGMVQSGRRKCRKSRYQEQDNTTSEETRRDIDDCTASVKSAMIATNNINE